MEQNDNRWKKVLMSGGALIGAAAAYNAFARKGVDQLTNLIGGEEGGFDWRGRRIAFTKRGNGPPILLDSRNSRRCVVVRVARQRRRISHAATRSTRSICSASAGPTVRRFVTRRVSTSRSFPISFSRLIGEPCVLVATSLSGAYAIVLAARDPQRFPAMALDRANRA